MLHKKIGKTFSLAIVVACLTSCQAQQNFNYNIPENSTVKISYSQRLLGPDAKNNDKIIKDEKIQFNLEVDFGSKTEYTAIKNEHQSNEEKITVSSPQINSIKLLDSSKYLKPVNYTPNDSPSIYTEKTINYFDKYCKNVILDSFKGKSAFELYSYTIYSNMDSYYTSDYFYDSIFTINQLSFNTLFGDKHNSFDEINNLKAVTNSFTCGIYNTIFTYIGLNK